MKVASEHGISPIDLVAVNLYPFQATAAKRDANVAAVIENIDIGGPSMLRSAAKNFAAVTVVVDPQDYPRVLATLEAADNDVELRRLLAEKVFPTPRPTMARSRSGSPANAPRSFPIGRSSRSIARKLCATARIQDSAPRSTARATATGSPASSRREARSFRSTTCSISRARCWPPIHSPARPAARS